MSLENLTKLTRLKYEFNSIMTQRVEFSLFQARQKYFEEGDKAGRLLAKHIKQKEAMSTIPAIRRDNERVLTDPKGINAAFRDFYINTSESKRRMAHKTVLFAVLCFM